MRDVYRHYERHWGTQYSARRWTLGPPEKVRQFGRAFRILVFPPRPDGAMWTYATVGMSRRPEAGRRHGLELHLHAPTETDAHVELLAVIAHYHLTGTQLGWAHTVNFGRPWYPDSRCSFGLISLPYLHGPALEWQGDTERSALPIRCPSHDCKTYRLTLGYSQTARCRSRSRTSSIAIIQGVRV